MVGLPVMALEWGHDKESDLDWRSISLPTPEAHTATVEAFCHCGHLRAGLARLAWQELLA
jgi:hypothetical protein